MSFENPKKKRPEGVVESDPDAHAEAVSRDIPEDFEDLALGQESKGRIVENKELGVSYRETVIELPKHRQEKYGITRIRRRELLPPLPTGFYTVGEYVTNKYGQFYLGDTPTFSFDNRFDPVYHFLIDGRLPAPDAWTHQLLSGYFPAHDSDPKYKERSIETRKNQAEILDLFKRNGLMFHEIYPSGANAESPNRFERTPDGFTEKYGVNVKTAEIGIPGLYCAPGRPFFTDYNTPIFSFSRHSTALRKYIDALRTNTNPEIQSLLATYGIVKDAPPLELIGPESPEYSDYIRAYGGLLKKTNEEECRENGYCFLRDSDCMRVRESVFQLIMAGAVIGGEVQIPIVKHPDIEPLRWCHAELAVVPTRRGLNVLFFETD
ncbi:MAG: hypothetical protein WC030_02985 [Candidatus Paceibacterota bacterium]